MAVGVALGDAIGRGFSLPRPYWLPMTIAIVLKPDFTATFSRGVLRLSGTFIGLMFATALFHVLPPSVYAQIAAIAVMMFVIRWLGSANYGILAIAVTGLVVLLISLTGIPAKDVMGARAANTALGGVIALAAYWLWPTWERHQVAEAIAQMLDAFRKYFRTIQQSYASGTPNAPALERSRG